MTQRHSPDARSAIMQCSLFNTVPRIALKCLKVLRTCRCARHNQLSQYVFCVTPRPSPLLSCVAFQWVLPPVVLPCSLASSLLSCTTYRRHKHLGYEPLRAPSTLKYKTLNLPRQGIYCCVVSLRGRENGRLKKILWWGDILWVILWCFM